MDPVEDTLIATEMQEDILLEEVEILSATQEIKPLNQEESLLEKTQLLELLEIKLLNQEQFLNQEPPLLLKHQEIKPLNQER